MTKVSKKYKIAQYILVFLFALTFALGIIQYNDVKTQSAFADSKDIVVYDFGETTATVTATQGTATIENGALKLTDAVSWWWKAEINGMTIPSGYSYMTLRMKANAEMNVLYRFSNDGGDNGSMCADETSGWAVTTAYQTFTVAISDSESLKSFGLCIQNNTAYIDYIMFHKDADARLDDYSGVVDFGGNVASVTGGTIENGVVSFTGATIWWPSATADVSFAPIALQGNGAYTTVTIKVRYSGTPNSAGACLDFIGTNENGETITLGTQNVENTYINLANYVAGEWHEIDFTVPNTNIAYLTGITTATRGWDLNIEIDYILFHNGTEQTLTDTLSITCGEKADLSVYKNFASVTVNGEAVEGDLSAYEFAEAGEYTISGVGVVNGVKTQKTTTVTVGEAETLTMFTGAAVRVKKDVSDKTGIRFAAKIENYAENANSYGMLIFPADYLETYSISGNYVAAFAAQNVRIADKRCLPVYGDFDNDGNNEYYIQASLTNIKYTNLNRAFVGIGYIVDANGDYHYTDYNEAKNSRSIAYVASAALKDYESDLTSDGYKTCLTYIHGAVNQKNGVAESEGYTTTSSFALSAEPITLTSLGERKALNVTQTPSMGYKISYVSNDTDIATVDENGYVTAVAEGSTKVIAKSADKRIEINVTVDLPDDYSGMVDFGGNVTSVTGGTLANGAVSFTGSTIWWPSATADVSFAPIALQGSGAYTTVTIKVRYSGTPNSAGACLDFIGTNENGETVTLGTQNVENTYINLANYAAGEWHEIDFTVPNTNIAYLTGVTTATRGWDLNIEIDYILFHNGTTETVRESETVDQGDALDMAAVFEHYAGVTVCVNDGDTTAATLSDSYTFTQDGTYVFTGVGVVNGKKTTYIYTVTVKKVVPQGYTDIFGLENYVSITATQGAVSNSSEDGATVFSGDWWVETTLDSSALAIPATTNYMILTMKADVALDDVHIKIYGTDGATIYYKEPVSGNGVSLTTEYREYKFLIETAFYNVEKLNVCAQNHSVTIRDIKFVSEAVDTDIVYQQSGVRVIPVKGVLSKDEDGSLLVHGRWWVELSFSGATIPADADKLAITLKTNASYTGTLSLRGTEIDGEKSCDGYGTEYKEFVFDLTKTDCDFTMLEILTNDNTGNAKVNIMSIRFYDSAAKMAYWGPVAATTDETKQGSTLSETDKANLRLYKAAGLNVFTITSPNALLDIDGETPSIEGTTTKAVLDYAAELGMKTIVSDSVLQCLSHSGIPLVKTSGNAAYAIWQHVEDVGKVYFAEGVSLGDTVTGLDGGGVEHTVTVDNTAFFQFDSQEALNAFVLARMSAYAKHSAYYGVEFWDEPKTDTFTAIGQLLDAVSYADKQLKTHSYVQQCLLPSYGFSSLADFKMYLTSYAQTITTHGNGIISTVRCDVYPLNNGKVECGIKDHTGDYIGSDYITCIQTLASVTKSYGLDWELTVQAYGDSKTAKRTISENGLKWQVAMAYAFGAKNVSYYSFTGDTHGNYDSCIVSGAYTSGYKVTDLYGYVQKATKFAESLQPIVDGYAYYGSTMKSVNKNSKYQTYSSYGYYYDAISDENVSGYSIDSATYTATLTKLEKNGAYAYGLMNMADPDKTATNSVKVTLNGVTSATVYKYDGANGLQTETVTFSGNSYTFSLAAGEGIIILPA